MEGIFAGNGNARPWRDQSMVGTPEQVTAAMRPYLGIGFRHFIVGFPPPYDAESMERLVREVKPMLEGG
jgi:alkanesulfonate monooxygenase SsuD/methylene tetrahydromethanopterin reductase-like flavin-dependent oxidoreductase (luciferase family)